MLVASRPPHLGQSLRHHALLLSGRGKPGTRRLHDCDDLWLRRLEAATILIAATRGHAFEIAIPIVRLCSNVLEGYPVSTSKKKRACVVTYRHSGDRLFENSIPFGSNVNNL
jgi:hypothetical protein